MSAVLRIENQAIGRIEAGYLKREFGQLHIACEEMDFTWSLRQVRSFREMWNEGNSIHEMAAYFRRAEEEIALLILDQASRGMIEPRKGGLFG